MRHPQDTEDGNITTRAEPTCNVARTPMDPCHACVPPQDTADVEMTTRAELACNAAHTPMDPCHVYVPPLVAAEGNMTTRAEPTCNIARTPIDHCHAYAHPQVTEDGKVTTRAEPTSPFGNVARTPMNPCHACRPRRYRSVLTAADKTDRHLCDFLACISQSAHRAPTTLQRPHRAASEVVIVEGRQQQTSRTGTYVIFWHAYRRALTVRRSRFSAFTVRLTRWSSW
jgi:hypothetical protein